MAAGVPGVRFDDPSVNFFVRDVERATQFYSDLLGFTETFRTPTEGVPVHVELRLGQFTLAVTSIEAALADHGLVVNPSSPSAELVAWTDDTDAAYAALTERGAKSLIAPHDFRQTHRVAWVADPEGNPIHLAGPISGPSHNVE